MNRHWLLIPLLSIASQTGALSQAASTLSPYASVHFGVIFPAWDNFGRIYESGSAFAFGADLGWNFATHANAFIQGLYYSKSVVPTYTMKRRHTEMKEFILLLGLNRPFALSELYTLDVSGAIATADLWEDGHTRAYGPLDNIGFSLGIGLERNFPGSNFAVMAEGEYTFLHDAYNGNLGGPTATLGLRYYFADREVKK